MKVLKVFETYYTSPKAGIISGGLSHHGFKHDKVLIEVDESMLGEACHHGSMEALRGCLRIG